MSLNIPRLPPEKVAEVALWCSLQTLTASHQDSPEEARRRGLVKEAGRLLAGHHERYLLLRHLPNWRWTHAMALLKEADPDALAPWEHQLRSPALKPAESIKSIDSEERRQEIVDSVIRLRSSLIDPHLAQEATLRPSQLQGRLLLYVPSENVSDESSRYASNGFFDPHDCPPWDIWLQYSNRTLISWVPELLIPLAQAGIDANPVACIEWAD